MLSRVVGLYLAPHLPKYSNCTILLVTKSVEIMLCRNVGLYLQPPPPA